MNPTALALALLFICAAVALWGALATKMVSDDEVAKAEAEDKARREAQKKEAGDNDDTKNLIRSMIGKVGRK